MTETIKLITILILIPIDLFIFIRIGKMMFGGWEGFFECVKHDLIPDWYSFFKGRLLKDWASEARLSIFGLLCGGIVVIEVLVFMSIFT